MRPRFPLIPLFLLALALALAAAAPAQESPKPEETRAITLPAPEERLEKIFSGQQTPENKVDLQAMQTRLRELSERVLKCTVGVQAGSGSGSGVIITEDGYVLTAGHVSGPAGREVSLILQDGRRVKGKTLGANHQIDSGLIKIDGTEKWPFAEMGRSGELKPGAWCLAAGHPGGFQVGRTSPIRNGRLLANQAGGLVTDCLLVGGDSGGPLFDMRGRVIGIHSRIGNNLVANIHVPVDTYRDTWDRLAKGEVWGQRGAEPKKGDAYLGVSGDAAAPHAKLVDVVPGSAADKAGLRVGDVIKRFGKQEIKDYNALVAAVRASKAGDEVEVEIERDGQNHTLKVRLGRFGE